MTLRYVSDPPRRELQVPEGVVVRIDGLQPAAVAVGGRVFRFEQVGPGWRFAYIDARGGEPRAWSEAAPARRGGRIVLAPDHEYRLRAKLLTGWRLQEDAAVLADLRPSSGKEEGTLVIEPRAHPSFTEDVPLLLAIACVMAVMELSIPNMGGGGGG